MNKQSLTEALRGSVVGCSPLVGFAAAADPLFRENRRVVSPTHALPEDLLPGARTVVAFFIPLARAVVRSNVLGKAASREWALAYIETNALLRDASLHLKRVLESEGYAAVVTPATHDFDPETLVSDWSHRHAACIAGLGRFGLNNMLITASGCCGRLGSLVTALELPPDPRPEREACLFRHDGSCRRCAARCVGDALSAERFDRKRCYAVCLQNEERHRDLGKADVCGKCLVGVPCSFQDPVRASRQLPKRGFTTLLWMEPKV